MMMQGNGKWLYAAVGVVLVGLGAWRLDALYQPLPLPAAADPQTGKLFSALHLTPAADGRVELPAPDTALAEYRDCLGKHHDGCKASYHARQQTLDDLYHTPIGQRIRQEVAAWNHTRRFAAIRDQSHTDDDTNHWQASTLDKRPLETRNLVPFSFARINGDTLPTGFHNWLSASHASQHILFSRTFDLKQAADITVQVIGTPDLSQTPQAKQASITPEGSTLVLHLPAGKTSVELPTTTTTNPEPQVDGLMLAEQQGQVVWMDAPPAQAETAGDSTTAKASTAGMPTGKAFQLFTRDGKPLTEADKPYGRPSQFTLDNGLLGLIGQDAAQTYALSGLLAKSSLPSDTPVRLTLDSQWQTLAQGLLTGRYTRKDDPTQALKAGQRTAIVVMNPNTGAILAAASTPTPPKGVHPWDRDAYASLYPNRDPFLFVPWQAADADFTPGSTFKLVTGLAVLQASEEDAQLKAVVRGATPAQAGQILGMDANAGDWQPPYPDVNKVNNFKPGESLSWLAQRALFRNACGRNANPSGKAGLPEALSESMNTWFAAVAVQMDKAKLGQDASQTQLLNMAKRLGFRNSQNLAPDGIGIHRYAPRIGKDGKLLGRGDVLNAVPSRMDLDDTDPKLGSWANRLVRTSFGHSLTTTPLQMLQVASATATNQNITPHLLQAWDGDEIRYPEPAELDIPDLDTLQAGMKAVTEQGTAAGAFGDTALACRTYGKTGTADTPDGSKTAWFVGWLADSSAKPQVAFACAVTQADKAGGAECAPLIHDLLAQALAKGLQP